MPRHESRPLAACGWDAGGGGDGAAAAGREKRKIDSERPKEDICRQSPGRNESNVYIHMREHRENRTNVVRLKEKGDGWCGLTSSLSSPLILPPPALVKS